MWKNIEISNLEEQFPLYSVYCFSIIHYRYPYFPAERSHRNTELSDLQCIITIDIIIAVEILTLGSDSVTMDFS